MTAILTTSPASIPSRNGLRATPRSGEPFRIARRLGVFTLATSRPCRSALPAVTVRLSVRGWILPGMASFKDQDLTDAEFRECDLTRARLIGVVMQDAVIDGLVTNLVVNGVEVTSYVEAELDRRHPVRLLLRSADPADLRQAGQQLRAGWEVTSGERRGAPRGVARGLGDAGVGGGWAAGEAQRHLGVRHRPVVPRLLLGSDRAVTADGPAAQVRPCQGEQGLDRAAAPSLDEVLAVRDVQG